MREVPGFRFSLRGREFHLRDLCRDDTERYLKFFNELSKEAMQGRFGHQLAKLTPATAEQRLNMKGERERALAVLDDQNEEILAIGRCFYESEDAEIAVVVADASRRLGLGRFMLDQLIEVARDKGCRSVNAYIGSENAPVIKLLQRIGFVVQPRLEGGDLQLSLNLSPRAEPRKVSAIEDE